MVLRTQCHFAAPGGFEASERRPGFPLAEEENSLAWAPFQCFAEVGAGTAEVVGRTEAVGSAEVVGRTEVVEFVEVVDTESVAGLVLERTEAVGQAVGHTEAVAGLALEPPVAQRVGLVVGIGRNQESS